MKTKIKVFVFLISISTLAATWFLVVNAEKQKRLDKYEAEKNYYNQLYGGWRDYKAEYEQQVAKLRDENKKQMEQTKKNYDDLLAQQPALIQQHTKTEQETVAVTTGSSTKVANSGSSNKNVGVVTKKSSSKIQVSKPASTPKTATS